MADLAESAPTPRPMIRFRWWYAIGLVGVVVVFVVARFCFFAGSDGLGPSNKAKCASNLHLIGLGITLYQNDHDGHYPDSMAEIVGMGVQTGALVCPYRDRPAGIEHPTTQQATALLATPGHCSYVYLGRGSWTQATVMDDAVVAYDRPAHHENRGTNILFGDGHADWIPNPRADRLIKAASATTRPVSAATVP